MPVPEKSSPVQTIADQFTSLYKTHYGRGPKTVSVHIVRDAVVCILQDVNTPVHRALVEFGAVDVAQASHHRLQVGMAGDMRRAVERITGRTVAAHVPGVNAEAAVTTDVFLLAPGDAVPGR